MICKILVTINMFPYPSVYRILSNSLHIIVIAPFLFYIALAGINQWYVPECLFYALALFAVIAFGYHTYRLTTASMQLQKDQQRKKMEQ